MEVLIDYAYRASDLADLPIEKLALFVMAEQNLPESAEVSISFVDDETMTDLNGRYRGKDGPTDVLSFECDGIDDIFPTDTKPKTSGGEPAFCDRTYELGDIVIAPDVAARQCTTYATTFEGEISLLLVHGLLHLCGYDHIDDDDAQIMEARERVLLGQWAERGHEAVLHVRDE